MTSIFNVGSQRSPVATKAARLRAAILLGALASFLLSVYLFFLAGNEMQGIFVGLWVPSILGLGSVLLPEAKR